MNTANGSAQEPLVEMPVTYSESIVLSKLNANPAFHQILSELVPELLADETTWGMVSGIPLPMLIEYLPSEDLKGRMKEAEERMKKLEATV